MKHTTLFAACLIILSSRAILASENSQFFKPTPEEKTAFFAAVHNYETQKAMALIELNAGLLTAQDDSGKGAADIAFLEHDDLEMYNILKKKGAVSYCMDVID